MAIPAIVAAAGIQAVSGLVQMYQAEKARKASKESLQKIEDMLNEIGWPDFDLSLDDPPSVIEEKLKRPEYRKRIKSPDYALEKMTPEQLKEFGRYSPKMKAYIDEKNPELLKGTEDTKRGREAQIAALERYQQIGKGEFDPEYQELVSKSQNAVNSAHQARAQSALQDMARRGVSGSGLGLISSIGSNAAALESSADVAQSAATQAYKNRLDALARGADLGSRISGEDYDIQERNNSLINSFNQRMAAGRQKYSDSNIDTENQAEQSNIGQYLRNQQRQEDLQRERYRNENEDVNYENRMEEQRYNEDKYERQRNRDIRLENARMRNQNKGTQNELKQRAYENKMNKARVLAGQEAQSSQMNTQNTQDRNNAYQGVANAGTSIFQAHGDEERRRAADEREDRREKERREWYERMQGKK